MEYILKKNVNSEIEENWGTDRKLGRRGWGPLSGTLKEITALEKLMRGNGILVNSRTGAKGLEDEFYKLLENKKPELLHIATHGFYESTEAGKSDTPTSRGALFKIRNEKDVLNRSGIVLTGANYFWKKGEKFKTNLEDGIVTSNELSSLNLRNTELVVLSACETGIGQNKGNEGVFGLQRGLKLAGAKRLLVSLWKVDDEVTQLFMQHFYNGLIGQKYPIQKAYLEAQEHIKKQYPEPYYWAAFSLIL